jgi:hypothetical protein
MGEYYRPRKAAREKKRAQIAHPNISHKVIPSRGISRHTDPKIIARIVAANRNAGRTGFIGFISAPFE